MSIETELKLRITPEALAKLRRHALLRTYAVTRPVTRRLYNIYFDTPKLSLHKSRMALRLRRVGRQWIQTLKGGGSVKGGLHQRNEWEVPVGGPALDFDLADMAEWDVHLPPSLRRKLRPVFVTDFSRSSRMLSYQGAEIELCMDQGDVSTEQASMNICELELELKLGEPRQLFELALAMLDVVPLELEVFNKAQYGYRLMSGCTDTPVKATVPNVRESETITEVLQALIWSCLQHLQVNLRGAMANEDAEYLHQMRVALRRLRVVLRMAEKLRGDDQLTILINQLAALCAALGKIREWDVFISQTLQPMCERMPDHAGLQVLLAVGEQRRAACHAMMRSEGRALDLQRFILHFSIWMSGPYWQQAEEVPQARVFATHYLCKLASRFSREGKQLKSPDKDMQKLHALRILAKRLRYSAEFFSCLYDKQARKAFLAKLSEIQEVLGRINDISVAHRLLDELGDETIRPASDLSVNSEGIALVKGWIANELLHEFTTLQNANRRFIKQPEFWEK